MQLKSPRSVVFVIVAVLALMSLAVAIPAMSTNAKAATGIDASQFSTTIDNPLFPLSSLETKVFEGEETDPDTGETITTRLESTVLDKTRRVAGVEVLVVQEIAYADGEVVEVAYDYFAQHTDGTVYYFGERVDNYEDGKIVDHDGSWLAGKNRNLPGIIMPAEPFVGQTFAQERAPGVAEDQGTIIGIDEKVKTPAGNFSGCVQVEEINPLELPIVPEYKIYCPAVGLVRDESSDGFIELVSY